MTACGRLQVIVRVEVTVYEDDRICSCQIQAHSPCKETSYLTTLYKDTNLLQEIEIFLF